MSFIKKGVIQEFNPYHDSQGRFTTGPSLSKSALSKMEEDRAAFYEREEGSGNNSFEDMIEKSFDDPSIWDKEVAKLQSGKKSMLDTEYKWTQKVMREYKISSVEVIPNKADFDSIIFGSNDPSFFDGKPAKVEVAIKNILTSIYTNPGLYSESGRQGDEFFIMQPKPKKTRYTKR